MGAESDFSEDLLVLEHLRGYPEELTRYANLTSIFAQEHRRIWRRADVVRYLNEQTPAQRNL